MGRNRGKHTRGAEHLWRPASGMQGTATPDPPQSPLYEGGERMGAFFVHE
jgi:hypothetical protein